MLCLASNRQTFDCKMTTDFDLFCSSDHLIPDVLFPSSPQEAFLMPDCKFADHHDNF